MLQFLSFTWNTTDFKSNYFVVQLNFANPLYVSSTGRLNLDKIQVTVLNPTLFTSKKSLLNIVSNTSLTKTLPG